MSLIASDIARAAEKSDDSPTVSVLVKSYNHVRYIRQTIESLLDQSFQDFEIVVTDDGSTDDTREILSRFSDPRIHVSSLAANQGISAAMNATIARARGRYLAILNSDDWALPNRLGRQVDFLDANPEISLLFGLPRLVNESGDPIVSDAAFTGVFDRPLSFSDFSRRTWLREFFFHGNCLCAPTAMIRREVYKSVGNYDRRLTNLQDLDMWVRALVAGYQIAWLPEFFTAFRVRANNGNMSAPRPDTLSRLNFETAKILAHFTELDARDFEESFGEEAARTTNSSDPVSLRVAELALEYSSPPYQRFALEAYYNTVKEPHQFRRLASLSGGIDLFNELRLKELSERLDEKDMQLREAWHHLDRINASPWWRLGMGVTRAIQASMALFKLRTLRFPAWRRRLPEEHRVKDGELNLYHRPDFSGIVYSDGEETELRILESVKKASDRSTFSAELARAISDWPSEYHLSRQRHCLVRPLNIQPADRVLELGCGCGAVTRYLGELGASVTGVEGSLRRAEIAAERCCDLPNVRIIAEDLLRFQSGEEFDWVLLIGVLEYAPTFSDESEPALSYLRKAAGFLKPRGRLVVAIENKFGLKYFNGCREDHVGIPFYGVQGLYGRKQARTFGKRELEEILKDAGLTNIAFWLPFPDYKLPRVVLSEAGLADPKFDPAELLATVYARDYGASEFRLFDEPLAFREAARNGLIGEFSNSFLVVASMGRSEISPECPLAVTYAVQRLPQFTTQTRLVREGEVIRVRKEWLFPDLSREQVFEEAVLRHVPKDSDYFAGHLTFWRLIEARARHGSLDEIVAALVPWFEYLLASASEGKTEGEERRLAGFNLDGRFLDLTPFNLLETKEGLRAIDFEWQVDGEIPLGWLVTRSILFCLSYPGFEADEIWVSDVIKGLSARHELQVRDSEIAEWFELEGRFQSALTGERTDGSALLRPSHLRKARYCLDRIGASPWWRIRMDVTRAIRASIALFKPQRRIAGQTSKPAAEEMNDPQRDVSPHNDYVPLLKENPIGPKLAKLICFYLPQFHAIPENNAWWGEGFTEWTNVRAAEPKFEGHYQPRIPGELGYYDLSNPEVERRQIELAKLYGIEGFCFYFYWFGGKRLLEKPLQNYLSDRSLDLPFCLCWANENWTRRWDGLDKDILIAQHHSPTDDIAFIAHVASYLRDPRYIRVNGKPLLIVYRPALLPSPKETVGRWRAWCRDNGVGEIYLAYTQSFERVDPAAYDFDAAIEFPPNTSAPSNITRKFLPRRDRTSAIYNWRDFPDRSEKYQQSKYQLFRTVCPSWDNTARRKNGASVFVNNTPTLYQRWLSNAIRDTRRRYANPDDQLVFVNAWNEWGEGAYLEPDARYGYAYLEATRMALTRAYSKSKKLILDAATTKIAVVIHVFYPNILREIMDFLGEPDDRCKIFVTTVSESAHEVRSIMQSTSFDYEISVHENRGRDILPFLNLLRTIDFDQYGFALKLHTKQSRYRVDGEKWRRQALSCLARPEQREWIIKQMCVAPRIGLIGSSEHLVSMRNYLGANRKNVEALAARLGRDVDFKQDRFIAGSMFLARSEALRPMMNIALSAEDFEPEASQLDGTMAHAVERAFGYSALAAGFEIASVHEGTGQCGARLCSTVNNAFSFANRT